MSRAPGQQSDEFSEKNKVSGLQSKKDVRDLTSVRTVESIFGHENRLPHPLASSRSRALLLLVTMIAEDFFMIISRDEG
jgi:hypothetical protein